MNLRDGLIAYYKFDENAANTTVVDSTGTQSNATASQNTSAMTATGKILTCLSFNGTTDYVNVPHAASQLTTSGLTISAWIYADTGGESNFGRIVDKSSALSGVGGYYLCTRGGDYMFQVNDGTQVISGTRENGVWEFVVVTVQADGTGQIYINGVASGSSANVGDLSGITTTTDLRIGNRAGATDRSYDGLIDELAIWNRALSTTEITQLYNSGSGFGYPFAYSMTADSGSFALTGTDVTLYYESSWVYDTKPTSSWTNGTKPTSSWTNGTKPTSSYTNDSK